MIEIFTDVNVGQGFSDGATEVADVCQSKFIPNLNTYDAFTHQLAGGNAEKTYQANAAISLNGVTKNYLLPAFWVPLIQTCAVAPLVPTTSACSRVLNSKSTQVNCGDIDVATTENICKSLGCCWTDSNLCVFSDTKVESPNGVRFVKVVVCPVGLFDLFLNVI